MYVFLVRLSFVQRCGTMLVRHLTGILGVRRSAPVDLPYVLGQVLNLLQLLKAFQLACLYLKAVCPLLNLNTSKCKPFRAWYLALWVLSNTRLLNLGDKPGRTVINISLPGLLACIACLLFLLFLFFFFF